MIKKIRCSKCKEENVKGLSKELGQGSKETYVVDWDEFGNKLKSLEVGDICYLGITEMSKQSNSNISLRPNDSTIIVELLKPLSGYGVKDALELLDSAKSVLLECTQIHEKYKP